MSSLRVAHIEAILKHDTNNYFNTDVVVTIDGVGVIREFSRDSVEGDCDSGVITLVFQLAAESGMRYFLTRNVYNSYGRDDAWSDLKEVYPVEKSVIVYE